MPSPRKKGCIHQDLEIQTTVRNNDVPDFLYFASSIAPALFTNSLNFLYFGLCNVPVLRCCCIFDIFTEFCSLKVVHLCSELSS